MLNPKPTLSRRDFSRFAVQGIGATALLHLLANESAGGDTSDSSSFRLPAKAKRVVQITLVGGLSHVDSLDYKPELAKFHGKTLQSEQKPDVFFGQVGLIRKNDWEFKQRGESGLWMSEMFPRIAEHADKLTIVRSMVADSANHTPALFVHNSGFQFNGYPALGSWLSYGLGSENDDLPAFVVLPDERSEPNGGSSNWTSGFLPAEHQGVGFKGGKSPVRYLFPEREVKSDEELATRSLLESLNSQYEIEHENEANLLARSRSYALAANMQMAVPELANIEGETADTLSQYGIDRPITADCGRRCLLARRMLERGVRFVQIYSGGAVGGNPRASWDAHENVLENHSHEASRIDQPVAALLGDLAQRGMLEDTLVLFTTEFGRTPFAQSAADTVGIGRDHNKYGFSVWLAGAGIQPGLAYGETDEVGYRAVDKMVTWNDFHATILHLLGIDHTKLTYYHNGIRRRLTNVHGEVVHGVLS